MNLRTIALLTLLTSCGTSTKEQEASADSTSLQSDTISNQAVITDELHDSDYGIHHFTFTVGNNVSEKHSLKFHLPDKKIYLYDNDTESGSPVQELPLSEDINYEEGYFTETPEANFNIMDYNFDGYKDISVIRITGTSNIWFDIYLYEPSAKKFVKHVELSELTSPEIDTVNQLILFHNNGGMAGGWYTTGVVQWRKHKPIIIREEEQTSSEEGPEVFVRTIRTLTDDGQMKVACRVQIQKLDDNKEKQCLLEGDWAELEKHPNLIFAESQENVVKVDGRNGACT